MADIQIVKRDGRRQSYDNKKVAAVVARAAAGFELDVSPLLDAVNNYVKEGIGSQEVMNFLILTALNLTSVENPDWKNVAGRLKLFDLYKKTALARNCNHCYDRLYDYPVFLPQMWADGCYDREWQAKYSAEELAEAGTFIKPAYDLVYDYAGINLLIKRYLCEYNDRIAELPQEMFLTIALLIEQNEKPEKRMAQVKDTYEKLANRKISLATPLLMNLRRPHGNLSSCFITVMDDLSLIHI